MHSSSQSPIKKKVFFVLGSLASGGSERVFWSVAQGLNKEKYEVAIVILNSKVTCYSTNLDRVRIIDLNTLKASKSFFSIYRLLKNEKPDVVFSTSYHINILVSLVARFIKSTKFIARASNIPAEQFLYENFRAKFYAMFSKISYNIFSRIICQTEYMQQAITKGYDIDIRRTIVIPNPVLKTDLLKLNSQNSKEYKLVIVARFTAEKGHDRLIDIFANLPANYHLSLVGSGRLKDEIAKKVENLNLNERVKFYGEIQNVQEVLAQHDLMLLTSHTEGFPNVVIESLSVGLPVVSFQVSGMKELITEGFNGYVVQQDDLVGFKDKIIQACTTTVWDHTEIKSEVYSKFDLEKVSQAYEQLIN